MAKKYNEYYLSWEEINKIIASAKNLKERVVLKILARTGMRRFELMNLRVKDLDFERKRIHITRGKGGTEKEPKARVVPIDDDTLQDLRFYLDGRRSGKLIQSNKTASEGISLSAINRIVSGAAERAKISNPNPKSKHLNPHIFRHSFSRLSLMEGIPFNIVQKIAGHADARTTLQMYGIPSITDVQHIYDERLSKRFSERYNPESDGKLSNF